MLCDMAEHLDLIDNFVQLTWLFRICFQQMPTKVTGDPGATCHQNTENILLR
jgi:hypothetical protein